MESQRFDQVVSAFAETGNRRRVLGVLAASVGIGSFSLLPPDVDAKKKKKTELCLNGQSVLASKKKKKKLLKQGATQGACPVSPPPGPPPPPTPNKKVMEDCTPGVDTCPVTPVELKCGAPTLKSQCSSTIQGHTNWCCVPVGKACTLECECCQEDPNVDDGYECSSGVCVAKGV